MSLRYASKLVIQGGSRVAQEIKDPVSKSLKDTAVANTSSSSAVSASTPSSSRQIRRKIKKSTAVTKNCAASEENRRRSGEESFRTVIYLSCWGPN
ncbi:hypothetical protein ZOSMA_278G00190 [Zostera marina]|uniref:Uncharacterized protein n=1 Tax=Zostera marina TaxID=29655 RepID=A0A0K9PDM0_ZOSMR|nr:hypothetical protein ZOSMA_278G00190 [Zostera marina]